MHLQGAVSSAGEQAAADSLMAALGSLEQTYAAALAAASSRGPDAGGPFARAAVVFLAGQRAILRAALASCRAWVAQAETGV